MIPNHFMQTIDIKKPEWLTKNLIEKITTIFEPKYKRKLTENEITEIAKNLTAVIEVALKFHADQYNKNLMS